jgi:hypothetical protein
MTFLRIFGQWIRFNDTEVEAVEESAALHENFPETEGSPQTATILLYVAAAIRYRFMRRYTDKSANLISIRNSSTCFLFA